MNKLPIVLLIIISITLISACTPADTGFIAMMGNANAPVLVEEFSDFECPACAIVSPELDDVIKRNPDIARLEYRHFPLTQHKYAFKAAEASECANDQGKFWEYSKVLFNNQNSLIQDSLITYAQNLGLDSVAFEKCLNSGMKQTRVKNDMYEGRRRQLSYTPSIYVNGQLVQWGGAEEFEKYLKSL